MKKPVFILAALLVMASAAFGRCFCSGYVDGGFIQISYEAENDDCGDPDAIDYTSGTAFFLDKSGKAWTIDADPGVCLF